MRTRFLYQQLAEHLCPSIKIGMQVGIRGGRIRPAQVPDPSLQDQRIAAVPLVLNSL